MQFTRLSNIYFLGVSILVSFFGITPVPVSTVAMPLAFVLGASLIREAYEDIKRWLADNVTNKQRIKILRDRIKSPSNAERLVDYGYFYESSFRNCQWKDVKCGDLVLIS